jgi:hypothetical protein
MKRIPLPIDITFFASPVLNTECKRELDQLREALMEDLAPRDTVEKIWVDDLAHLVWEKRRVRRAKTAILNSKSTHAVQNLLYRPARGFTADDQEWAKTLSGVASEGWLTPAGVREDLAGVREDIIKYLGKFGLDESSIEAETMRLVAEDFEKLDRMEASLGSRFQKTLRAMAEYRQAFADQARIASNRIIEAEAAPVINLLGKRRTKKAD